MGIFLDIMKEELARNLRKQDAFRLEMSRHPKGYLSICRICGAEYVYRKSRVGNKILSEYIGVPGDEKVQLAQAERDSYLLAKRSLAECKDEEKRLRRAIKNYGSHNGPFSFKENR